MAGLESKSSFIDSSRKPPSRCTYATKSLCCVLRAVSIRTYCVNLHLEQSSKAAGSGRRAMEALQFEKLRFSLEKIGLGGRAPPAEQGLNSTVDGSGQEGEQQDAFSARNPPGKPVENEARPSYSHKGNATEIFDAIHQALLTGQSVSNEIPQLDARLNRLAAEVVGKRDTAGQLRIRRTPLDVLHADARRQMTEAGSRYIDGVLSSLGQVAEKSSSLAKAAGSPTILDVSHAADSTSERPGEDEQGGDRGEASIQAARIVRLKDAGVGSGSVVHHASKRPRSPGPMLESTTQEVAVEQLKSDRDTGDDGDGDDGGSCISQSSAFSSVISSDIGGTNIKSSESRNRRRRRVLKKKAGQMVPSTFASSRATQGLDIGKKMASEADADYATSADVHERRLAAQAELEARQFEVRLETIKVQQQMLSKFKESLEERPSQVKDSSVEILQSSPKCSIGAQTEPWSTRATDGILQKAEPENKDIQIPPEFDEQKARKEKCAKPSRSPSRSLRHRKIEQAMKDLAKKVDQAKGR